MQGVRIIRRAENSYVVIPEDKSVSVRTFTAFDLPTGSPPVYPIFQDRTELKNSSKRSYEEAIREAGRLASRYAHLFTNEGKIPCTPNHSRDLTRKFTRQA